MNKFDDEYIEKNQCEFCGAKKTIYIDGSLVCDSCEVGGILHDKKHKNLDDLFDSHEKKGTLPTRKEVQNIIKNSIKGLKEEYPRMRKKGRKLRKADNNIDQIVGAMVGIIAESGAMIIGFIEDELMPSIQKKSDVTKKQLMKRYNKLEVDGWEKKLKKSKGTE